MLCLSNEMIHSRIKVKLNEKENEGKNWKESGRRKTTRNGNMRRNLTYWDDFEDEGKGL